LSIERGTAFAVVASVSIGEPRAALGERMYVPAIY
jgi:hypothetical protein